MVVGGWGGDDRCLYSLREIESHNESGRCVSRGSFSAGESLDAALTLPALNTDFGSFSGDGIISLRLHRLHRISRLFFASFFFSLAARQRSVFMFSVLLVAVDWMEIYSPSFKMTPLGASF